jgi:hypothetical protein
MDRAELLLAGVHRGVLPGLRCGRGANRSHHRQHAHGLRAPFQAHERASCRDENLDEGKGSGRHQPGAEAAGPEDRSVRRPTTREVEHYAKLVGRTNGSNLVGGVGGPACAGRFAFRQ